MPERDEQLANVERYLRLLVWIGSPFAISKLVGALVFGSPRLGLSALALSTMVGVAAWGRREARRGRAAPVLRRAGWVLLLVPIVGATAVPQLSTTYVLFPVLALAATLSALERPVLGRFIAAAVVTELVVGCAQAFLAPAPGVPRTFAQVTVVTGLGGGAVVMLVLLVQSRLQLRQRLRETVRSEARFRSLVQASAAVVWTADAEGRLNDSPLWRAFTGQTQAQAEGLGWVEALHPHERAEVLHAWREAVSSQRPLAAEARVRRAQGGYAWLQVRAAPVRGPAGQVLEWVGAAVDMTAQRLAEERRRWLAEVSVTLTGTLDLDEMLQRIAHLAVPRLADGCVVRLFEGPAPEHVAGVAHVEPEEELRLGALVAHPLWLGSLAFGSAEVQRTGRSHLVENFAARTREALGDAPPALARGITALAIHSVLSVPLTARGGHALGALSLLTTGEHARSLGPEDLEAAEEVGRRCALALENALLYRQTQDAVRTREDFLAVASHELRTPLAALTLSLEGLERHLHLSEAGPDAHWIHERLQRLRRHARRLERLVEALLDVARISGGRLQLQLEEVELSALTREAVERLREEAGPTERVGQRVKVDAPEPVVGRWDRLRVEQAVENLVVNALKYGERGPVYVSVGRQGAHALLRVTDEGLGIPPEKHAGIWGKFERHVSGRHYGGLGLGLFIVREAVEALGGQVSVDSAAGRGATFTVQLPLAGPAPQRAGPAEARPRGYRDLPPSADSTH